MYFIIRGVKSSGWLGTPSGFTSTSISTRAIENIVDRLKLENNRRSTKRTYYNIWKSFNEFYIKLDVKPKTWEERLVLFVGYLLNDHKKSTTIRSYVSAIRTVLAEDGIVLNENTFLLASLTKACRIKNDRVRTRFPIQKGVLKILLKTTQTYFKKRGQPYLCKLYRAIFVAAYFGLLIVGELTASPHVILAKNVHIGDNKKKLLFLLESSKTHGKDKLPQSVKMSARSLDQYNKNKGVQYPSWNKKDNICAFTILREYLRVRPMGAKKKNEQFFCLF